MTIDTIWGGDEPLDYLLDILKDNHIDDAFDEYGSYCAVARSARPGEWGYFILAQEEDQDEEGNEVYYTISLQIPVDSEGSLVGPGRLVFNTPDQIIEEMPLTVDLTVRIYDEAHGQILEGLKSATLPDDDDDLPLADYGIWIKRSREIAS